MARTIDPSIDARVNGGLEPPDPSVARRLATAVAVVFLAVGVLGFVPGVTSDLDDITFAGHESGAELLGVFQVSVLHNLVHLLFGVVGLAAARRGRTAVLYLLVGGAVYLALAAYGALVEQDHDANVVPVNAADDLLHLGLGVGMIGLGLLARSIAPQRGPGRPAVGRPRARR